MFRLLKTTFKVFSVKKIFSTEFRNVFLIILSVLIVLLDQFWKFKIRYNGGFFVCNKGISFGLNFPYLNYWLLLGFIAILFFFIKSILSSRICFTLIFGYMLILTGAFSNILDRFFLNCVTDHISTFIPFFPLFNLADIAISIGSIIVFFHLVLKSK